MIFEMTLKIFGILIFSFLLCAIDLRADIIAIGSMTTVSNATVNSSTLFTNNIPLGSGKFSIANNGLTSTNALTAQRQFSIDGTNWIGYGGPYTPSSTNASAGDNYGPVSLTIPIYTRLSVTTTNSVQLNATFAP